MHFKYVGQVFQQNGQVHDFWKQEVDSPGSKWFPKQKLQFKKFKEFTSKQS